MPVLASGSSVTFGVHGDQVVTLDTFPGTEGYIVLNDGPGAIQDHFGPMPMIGKQVAMQGRSGRLTITSKNGAITYSLSVSVVGMYLGLVGSRSGCYSGRLAGNFQAMGRSKHVAMEDISSLQLGFGNFYVNAPSPYEYTPGGASQWTASVEYPVGTLTVVKFSGATAGAVADGGFLLSDVAGVVIPRGATFYVRTWQSNPAGIILNQEYGLNNVTGAVPTSGEWMVWGVTTPDLTQATTNSNNQGLGRHLRPTVIVGMTARPTFFLAGDSRLGQGDNFDTSPSSYGLRGEVERSAGKRFATFNAGAPGEKLSEAIAGNYSKRFQFAQYCSGVICEYGVNDIDAGASLATVLANLATFAGTFGAKPFYQTTIPPHSDSTDGFVTLGNQTVHSVGANGVRVSFNNSVRNGLAAPVSGGIEVADQVESSRDSGLWKAGGRGVTDAAITIGTNTLTSATAAFTASDVGRTVLVYGAAAAGGVLNSFVQSVTNATTAVLNTNASTTVAAAICAIGANTGDGLHGSSIGFALIETSTAFQGLPG